MVMCTSKPATIGTGPSCGGTHLRLVLHSWSPILCLVLGAQHLQIYLFTRTACILSQTEWILAGPFHHDIPTAAGDSDKVQQITAFISWLAKAQFGTQSVVMT